LRRKLDIDAQEADGGSRPGAVESPHLLRRSAMSTNRDDHWNAVQTRDASKDGTFVYGVATTGVYCRPSCASRRPLRKNVRFYATPADAARDGFRACLRCKPDAAGATRERVDARMREAAVRIARDAGLPLSLKTLAEAAGLSPFHFQRRFKAEIGLTPKAFHEAERVRSLKRGLRSAPSVTDAIYDAGFGSSSRVYERVDTRLGMTPTEYRRGGEGLSISHASAKTPLGRVMIGATDRGICFIQFGDDEASLRRQLADEYPKATLAPMPASQRESFAEWMGALGDYLDGRRAALDLPLDVRGTAFQMLVWRYLQAIPHGEVASYAEVARGIGRPDAARAVARACATNRIALAIPCHRVIRGDGELGGYRWGLERKRTLIDVERGSRARPPRASR
jgi:AraC family transcriptional regulator of adaptative response/methylated-DNA-[protein]-cysteine methyltransferase